MPETCTRTSARCVPSGTKPQRESIPQLTLMWPTRSAHQAVQRRSNPRCEPAHLTRGISTGPALACRQQTSRGHRDGAPRSGSSGGRYRKSQPPLAQSRQRGRSTKPLLAVMQFAGGQCTQLGLSVSASGSTCWCLQRAGKWDEFKLWVLGYKQELPRTLTFFNCFASGISIMSIWTLVESYSLQG